MIEFNSSNDNILADITSRKGLDSLFELCSTNTDKKMFIDGKVNVSFLCMMDMLFKYSETYCLIEREADFVLNEYKKYRQLEIKYSMLDQDIITLEIKDGEHKEYFILKDAGFTIFKTKKDDFYEIEISATDVYILISEM